ncbi:MAG TPA: ABC transporter ATP-binding protein [Acetobacteraceae bacterium]|nr:ABC transporter ATP-binding protein [Acetobacteraceae bacterium]
MTGALWASAARAGTESVDAAAKITIRDLSIDYATEDGRSRHRAVEGLSLDVRENEFLAVVGPSGCGKSTLIAAIAGFLRPCSGSLLLDGRMISGPGADRGVVFQEYALLPWRTVLDNVTLGLRLRGVARVERDRIGRQFLETINLADAAGKYPHQLSGGMKQRVAVARTLANRPEIMLMDEPFAAVDAQSRMTLQEELVRIWSQSRVTVLFVTHSVEEAVFLADRVAVLTPGPGRLKATIDVDIPREERSWAALGGNPRFAVLRERVLGLVRGTEGGP